MTAIAEAVVRTTEQGVRMSHAIIEIAGAEHLADNPPVAVLARLWLDGPLRPRELAGMIGVTSAGVTKLIDRLEARGLAVRRSDVPDDGRGVFVDLTEQGRRTTGAMLEVLGPVLSDLAEDLQTLLIGDRPVGKT